MSKEKQIEEMKKVLDGVCDVMPLGECYDVDCEFCKATALYNAGYRKQSEGEWVKESINNTRTCSICGEAVTFRSKFCPNCGAKMKGGV